jgi:predicted NUDIX family NTP pyrophosphohydrolase
MPKPKAQSSGTLLYRTGADGLEVLLVHPSGSYNKQKPWSIPKGLPDHKEELEAAARRETWEETSVVMQGALSLLGSIIYTKSRKQVWCFAGAAPADAAPKCASWEVDRAEFVSLDRAREILHPEQRPFIDWLAKHLENGSDAPAPDSD